ncbi:MAG: PAS domain S-box protein, partial [Spirochaetes bacterium]|nr:PAS domain S-box protein [Spirochaetota bacterium]
MFLGFINIRTFIIDRNRTDEALRNSEDKFKYVFDHSITGKSITLPSGEINVNRAFCDLLGYSPEQLQDRKWQDITHPDDIEFTQKILDPVLSGEIDSARFTKRYIRANGSIIWTDVATSLRQDDNGRALYFMTCVSDITDRMQAKDALIVSENRYRRLFESAKDGILILDAETGIILDVNPFLIEMLGYSYEQFIEKAIWEIGAFKDKITNKQNFIELQEKEYIRYEDMPLVTYNGRKIDVEFVSNVYFEDHLKIIQCNIRDITNRKRTEDELKKYHDLLEELVKQRTDELRNSRNLLRTLIDSLPDDIYAKDTESRFIMANNCTLKNLGLGSFSEILGKTDFDILPNEEAAKVSTKEHTTLLRDGNLINYEEQVTGKDGKIHWLDVTKAPMRDREGNVTGLVGINRDITHIKEFEENLKEAKEAAESANIAKSVFLSSMSHEIRTPLNAILGYSQLLQNDGTLSEEQKSWLEIINRSGEHLLILINDILEVSRIESGHITFNPSNFDLHALLRDIEAMFRIKTDAKNLTLLFEHADELPGYITTDEAKLRQIIINLVGNAVKFTKEGGLALRARVKHENDKTRLVVEVEDTGPGISEKDMGKMFQKFGQAEAGIREGGTGLGLAISQQYARLMGGIITVKSEEGKGACFILTIDIDGSETLDKEEKKRGRVIGLKPGLKQYRILIADDNADNREFLRIMLTSAGFDVEEARDGNDAIAKLKIWRPELILMDMQMPVLDGYEATRMIKAMENGKIHIIAVTASAFQEDRQKAIDAGADAYLRKPFKERELFDRIKEVCAGVQYVYQ